MSSKLPLNLDDLLRQRTVEGDRIEYKAGWNPDATVQTLCAFANDFENLGGGSIKIEALNGDKIVARRYRNRRIGEFLKELDLTEGRSTGIPTIREAMANNGSPPPRFSTDEGRTHFLAELPVHPELAGGQDQDGVQDGVQDPELAGVQDGEGGRDGVQDLGHLERRILAELEVAAKSTTELVEILGYSGRSRNLRKALLNLQTAGLVELTIPDKPNSKYQERRITKRGRAWLARQADTEAGG